MKRSAPINRSNPRPVQVRHLRRKHGLSENTARLVAELLFEVKS